MGRGAGAGKAGEGRGGLTNGPLQFTILLLYVYMCTTTGHVHVNTLYM